MKIKNFNEIVAEKALRETLKEIFSKYSSDSVVTAIAEICDEDDVSNGSVRRSVIMAGAAAVGLGGDVDGSFEFFSKVLNDIMDLRGVPRHVSVHHSTVMVNPSGGGVN